MHDACMGRYVGLVQRCNGTSVTERARRWTARHSPILSEKKTMRKYLLAVFALIAGTIIAAETAERALDANGNAAKKLIPRNALKE